jgi:hypothetical protein
MVWVHGRLVAGAAGGAEVREGRMSDSETATQEATPARTIAKIDALCCAFLAGTCWFVVLAFLVWAGAILAHEGALTTNAALPAGAALLGGVGAVFWRLSFRVDVPRD